MVMFMVTKKNLNFFNKLKKSMIFLKLKGSNSFVTFLDDVDEEGNIYIMDDNVCQFISNNFIFCIRPVYNVTREEFEERKRMKRKR